MEVITTANELYHHGILGQRWGLRRYQNKDGSLTPAGKKRYKIQSRDRYDIIKKGSSFQRIANSGERIDDRRKYVSLTDSDNYDYDHMSGKLWADNSKAMSTYVYKANKDLKIATGKRVAMDLLNKYGDQKIKNVFRDYEEEKDEWGEENTTNIYRDSVRKFFQDTMKQHGSEIIENYKKQKYDGIIDVEDWYHSGGFAEYPVILLNPKNNISLINESIRR